MCMCNRHSPTGASNNETGQHTAPVWWLWCWPFLAMRISQNGSSMVIMWNSWPLFRRAWKPTCCLCLIRRKNLEGHDSWSLSVEIRVPIQFFLQKCLIYEANRPFVRSVESDGSSFAVVSFFEALCQNETVSFVSLEDQFRSVLSSFDGKMVLKTDEKQKFLTSIN